MEMEGAFRPRGPPVLLIALTRFTGESSRETIKTMSKLIYIFNWPMKSLRVELENI